MIAFGVRPDVAVIETTSDGGGIIEGARAVADHDGVLVYGTVRKQSGYDGVSTRSYYIDVTVLNSSGKVIAKVKTDFFPHEIPHTTSRSNGFSTYRVRLSKIPPEGSKIIVAFRAFQKGQNDAGHRL